MSAAAQPRATQWRRARAIENGRSDTHESIAVVEGNAEIDARGRRLVDGVLRTSVNDLVDDGTDGESEEGDDAEEAREDEGAAAGEKAGECGESSRERAGEDDVGCAFSVRAEICRTGDESAARRQDGGRRAKSPNAHLSAVKTLAGRTFCSKSTYCVGMSSIRTCAGSKRSLMLRSMQYERGEPRLPFVEQ